MFFIMGITQGQKEFAHNQVVVCDRCGAYGRYMVFMTYTVLSLFFIPCFKWNRRYFVRTSCCGTVYQLNAEIGRRIERGEEVEIRPEHLQGTQWTGSAGKRCSNCGFTTTENFEYCPKCGKRF
ncbi:MAG: zinc ribbon domain-containing protein [Lachnospiraceae bacterium]|nr:zinc ribbon domain-containing protein [Robinsoniella sp.]MDY3765291.1 zinc ribbon domain-containing protein [Lachnospiraceae bacterium]